MSVTRSWFFSLHLVPINGAVVFVPIKTGPLIRQDVVNPEGIGDFAFTFSLAFLLVSVEALETKTMRSF